MTSKPSLQFLIGIVGALSVWVTVAYLLPLFGFDLSFTFVLAHTAAIAVMGGFLYKIYKTIQAPPPVVDNDQTRCLILSAPTHGILQDRANYWLGGKYGKVVGLAISVNDKSAHMAIFYSAPAPKELEVKEAEE